jgi:hypothetical protein
MSLVQGNFVPMENSEGFEGLSSLGESTVRLHERYESLMAGRFTKEEALWLIVKMTKSRTIPKGMHQTRCKVG